jgi:hypothetical protein
MSYQLKRLCNIKKYATVKEKCLVVPYVLKVQSRHFENEERQENHRNYCFLTKNRLRAALFTTELTYVVG